MLARLIRIYTPFICAVAATIHGVLLLCKVNSIWLYVLGEFTGHSIFLILYIIATTNKRMCKWYRITNYLLLTIHILNLAFYAKIVPYENIIYYGLVLNILALISFLIYRFTVGITKMLRLYGTRSIERE